MNFKYSYIELTFNGAPPFWLAFGLVYNLFFIRGLLARSSSLTSFTDSLELKLLIEETFIGLFTSKFVDLGDRNAYRRVIVPREG